MKIIQYVFVAGDLHGCWEDFNVFINRNIRQNSQIQKDIDDGYEVEVILLQVGDFGFWPHFDNVYGFDRHGKKWDQWGIKHKIPGIKNDHIKIIWCAGNHENHDVLDEIERNNTDLKFIEINKERAPNIFYATFGAVYTLLDETNIMFCGGADSIDKDSRVPGYTWWSGETISSKDMYKLPEIHKMNYIVSHTCPNCVDTYFKAKYNSKLEDPSKKYLDYILDNFNPDKWLFGHYHFHLKVQINKCEFECYNLINGSEKYFDLLKKVERNF